MTFEEWLRACKNPGPRLYHAEAFVESTITNYVYIEQRFIAPWVAEHGGLFDEEVFFDDIELSGGYVSQVKAVVNHWKDYKAGLPPLQHWRRLEGVEAAEHEPATLTLAQRLMTRRIKRHQIPCKEWYEQ